MKENTGKNTFPMKVTVRFNTKLFDFFQRNAIFVFLVSHLVNIDPSKTVAVKIDPRTLPLISSQVGSISYWDDVIYANAMAGGGGTWQSFNASSWDIWSTMRPEPCWVNETHLNPNMDIHCFPRRIEPGRTMQKALACLHMNYENRPPSWPKRNSLCRGMVTVTWRGSKNTSISLWNGVSLGPPTNISYSSLWSNETSYWSVSFDCSGHLGCGFLRVESIDESDPPTYISAWLPDPISPTNTSLIGHIWHPAILERLKESDWTYNRFMDFQQTNQNAQQRWRDRRLPLHSSQTGILNPRNVQPLHRKPDSGPTGMAIEHVLNLSNEVQLDPWICIPHLATDDYIRNLALAIRYGTDGVKPLTSFDSTVGLDPQRKIYLEYSNEIWAGGHAFPQGDYAVQMASSLNISHAEFVARRYVEVWRIFHEAFGLNTTDDETQRVVNVAAVWTSSEFYTKPFLDEIARYGATVYPPIEPDIIAGTTYFGNDIQYYADRRAKEMANVENLSDRWFYYFPVNSSSVSTVATSDPYWNNSVALQNQLDECFDTLLRRMLRDSTQTSYSGRDQVGIGGGFSEWLKDLADTTFNTSVPLVSYEGSFYLYTNQLDHGGYDDDGPTIFMEAMNRNPRLEEVQEIHLNIARAKGLTTHGAFTMLGKWSKYGCGAHLEYIDQNLANAPKYRSLLALNQEFKHMRHPDFPINSIPVFLTNSTLPPAKYLEYYSATINVSCQSSWCFSSKISEILVEGLKAVWVSPSTLSIRGTPMADDTSYVYVRALDSDLDPAWRTFKISVQGAGGILFESDLKYGEGGIDPSKNRPWKSTTALSPSINITGWEFGNGVFPWAWGEPITSGIGFTVSVPNGGQADSTIDDAISLNQYLMFSLTNANLLAYNLDLAGARVRFSIRRRDYWSPVTYAIFTSIEGFSAPQVSIYNTTTLSHGDFRPYTYETFLPSDSMYDNLNSFQIRIYCFGARWGGHVTTLIDFKLSSRFQWKLAAGSGICTVSCGGGTVTRSLECWDSISGDTATSDYSCPLPKPEDNAPCNTHQCGLFEAQDCNEDDLRHLIVGAMWECQGSPPVWCADDIGRIATCSVTDGTWLLQTNPSLPPSTTHAPSMHDLFVDFEEGSMPLILSAPHGGNEKPAWIPNRTRGSFLKDTGTWYLAHDIANKIEELTGKRPYLVANRLHRIKMDANRGIVEATEGNPLATIVYRKYHNSIENAISHSQSGGNKNVILIDLHGYASPPEYIILGHRLSSDDLLQTDEQLIKNGYDPEWVRGNTSIGTFLEKAGLYSVPSSSTQTKPNPEDKWFSGGYITRTYVEVNVKTVQFELPTDMRFTADNRAASVPKLSQALINLLDRWIAGSGIPSLFPSSLPSSMQTQDPTSAQSDKPSWLPSGSPSHFFSKEPTSIPSVDISSPPSLTSEEPSTIPSVQNTDRPSQSPTKTPTISCFDEINFRFQLKKQSMSCQHKAFKKRYCNKWDKKGRLGKNHCPETCQYCYDIKRCANENGRKVKFNVGKGKKKKCEFLPKRKLKKICDKKYNLKPLGLANGGTGILREICRKRCQLCG